MNYRDFYSYQMILRVREFGAQQAVSFPPTSLGAELFARVSAAAAKLEQHFADQSSGQAFARQGTASRGVARAALTELLGRMRRTSRAISRKRPDFEARFRLPRKQVDKDLIATAEAIATAAVPEKNEFLNYGMPDDFLEQLDDLIEEFRRGMNKQETGRGNRLMATAAIEDTLEEAIDAVRDLNAIVRNTFADDPVLLAAWTSARHVRRLPRTADTSSATASTNQPASPPPTAS